MLLLIHGLVLELGDNLVMVSKGNQVGILAGSVWLYRVRSLVLAVLDTDLFIYLVGPILVGDCILWL